MNKETIDEKLLKARASNTFVNLIESFLNERGLYKTASVPFGRFIFVLFGVKEDAFRDDEFCYATNKIVELVEDLDSDIYLKVRKEFPLEVIFGYDDYKSDIIRNGDVANYFN